MAYAAVLSLRETLYRFKVSPRIHSSPSFNEIMGIALEELKFLEEVLKGLDTTSKGSSRKKVNALDAEIKDAVWKFQDLVESHLYHQILPQSDQILELNLQELEHDVDRFVKMLEEKEEEYDSELDDLSMCPEEEDEAAPSATTQTAADSGGRRKFQMVGSSSDILYVIISTRMDFSNPVNVVPVVGMAGIGKTAAAREFFDNPLLFSELEMECRAWVTVGRKPRIRTIKRDILTQLDPDPASSRDGKIRERDVKHLLKGIFKAKRCLVVLDDVWDTYVWDELASLFPDYGRARNVVLLTTRLGYVGDEADKSRSKMRCEVELLRKDESWDLLRQRVFGEEECPPEFIKSGKKIAEKCDGLPLMIVAVAALLSEAQMTEEFWEEVAEKANHPIFTEAYDQLYEVLIPSYEYLPQHLKPCFLHMGVFPQYGEIGRSKLFCFWVVEGFLDPTMEDPFHAYLSEVIDHSVVMVCQTSSRYPYDNMKTCRLHSCFWHLCCREATASKFCRVLTSRDDGFQQLTIKGQRRLSFHNNLLFGMTDVVDSVEEACASSARSLLCYGTYHPYPVPICFGLRLLKLLDALHLRFYEFPIQVLKLVYLRNERIRFSGATPYVPVEIWDMKELQHIEMEGWNLPYPPHSSTSLEALFVLIGVGAETCTREVLERLPNLAKLGILIESRPNVEDGMGVALDCLNNIQVLRKLTSLKCVVANPIMSKRNEMIAAPPLSMFVSSLVKLHLSGLGYPWECMGVVGALPNLKVLKLRCYAFRGPKWVVRYGEFRALEYLVIASTDLVHFQVQDRGLLRIRRFCLINCYKLKHLRWEPDLCYPLWVAVMHCSPSAATFAKELRLRSESHSQIQHMFYVHSSWEDDENSDDSSRFNSYY